jgi:hypothetical protein
MPEGVAVPLMNLVEMREALRRAGIADDLYEVVGLHRAAYSDGFDFIERRDDEWVIGFQERGQRGIVARYRTEDEACRAFYDQLVKRWTPRPQHHQTPAEEERGRRITEEAVRKLKDMMNKERER